MRIHKEGYLSIVVIFILVTLIDLAVYYFFPIVYVMAPQLLISAVFFFYIVRFFRHPIRIIENKDSKTIYAPADGKVVVIEEVEENEYLKEKRIQVSIFMSPLDIHVNWIPIKGIISYFKYHKGKHLVAFAPKSSEVNERTTTVIKTENNTEILMRQIAGAVARRIVYYAKESTKFDQGDELGFIKFGSRVDLFLPLDSEILVNLEDKTVGNRTIIAKLK